MRREASPDFAEANADAAGDAMGETVAAASARLHRAYRQLLN